MYCSFESIRGQGFPALQINKRLIILSLTFCGLFLLPATQTTAQEPLFDFNQNGKLIKIVSLVSQGDGQEAFISPASSDSSVIAITDISVGSVTIEGQTLERQVVLAELKRLGEATLSVGTNSRSESYTIPVFNPLLSVEIPGVLAIGALPQDDFVQLEENETYQVLVKSVSLEDEPELDIQAVTRVKLSGSPAFAFSKNMGDETQGSGLLSVDLKVAENSSGEKTKLIYELTDTRSPNSPTQYQLSLISVHSNPTSADAGNIQIPALPVLKQNYPNPFNPETTIAYRISTKMSTILNIHNLKGELVRTLVDGIQPPGSYSVHWDGNNDTGTPVPAGVYFYQLVTDDIVRTNRMILLK